MKVRRVRDEIYLRRHQCGEVLSDAKVLADETDDNTALVTAARFDVACQQRSAGFALFDKALAVKPEAFIYINRALSRPPSDHEGIVKDVDAAIKLEPKSGDWIAIKADEMDRVGDRKAALDLYNQALALDPDNFGFAVNRAVIMYRLGQTDEATKLLATLKDHAKTPTDLNNLCWAKATAGILLDSALADCQAALKLRPDTPGYLDSLGMALLRLGRYNEAIAAYDKAIAGGTGAISLMGRSIARAHIGQKALADADKKAAIADDPDIGARAQRYNLPF